MGNLFSTQSEKEFIKADIVESTLSDIEDNSAFKKYQEMFKTLKPSRDLYVDYGNENIIISQTMGYSEHSFNWTDISVTGHILEWLNNLYEMYYKQNIYQHPEVNSLMLDHDALDFVDKSLYDNRDWPEWVDQYFLKDSDGHNMFIAMEKEYPLPDISYEFDGLYPPYIIWMLLIINSADLGTIYAKQISGTGDSISSRIGEIVEIVDQDGLSLVYTAKVDGRWWYVGINEECFDRIDSLYQKQSDNQK